jgi:membrane protein implicated in regulation of membrane protease activity
VGGVVAVDLPQLPCLLIVAALVVGAIMLARRPRRAVSSAPPLVGVRGVVTAAVPLGGFGEIRARVGERSLRLKARADRPLPLGARVTVIQQVDESTVLVRETTAPGPPGPSAFRR